MVESRNDTPFLREHFNLMEKTHDLFCKAELRKLLEMNAIRVEQLSMCRIYYSYSLDRMPGIGWRSTKRSKSLHYQT